MDRKAVKVRWLDPYSIDEWTSISEKNEEILLIESFGYEIHRDEKGVTIALNYDPENEKMSCATVIPEECIKEYRYLESDSE
jgi:hypothetical protein